MKRLVSLVLMVTMILSSNIFFANAEMNQPVFSTTPTTSDLNIVGTTYAKTSEYPCIQKFISDISGNVSSFSYWNDCKLVFVSELQEIDGVNTIANLFELQTKKKEYAGYLITTPSNEKVIEFSNDISPYTHVLPVYTKKKFQDKNIVNEILAYSPGFHAVKIQANGEKKLTTYFFTEDNEVDISREEMLSVNPVAASINVSKELDKSLINMSTTTYTYKKISGVPDRTQQISCVPSAITNIIMYWDTHGYANLVSSTQTGLDVETTISDYLIQYNGSNTNNAGIPYATEKYCHISLRYPNNFHVTPVASPSFSSITTEVDANRPCLLGFSSSNTFYSGPHMTTAVGYVITTANDVYSIVHDGHPDTIPDYQLLWGSYNDYVGKIIP